MKSQNLVCFFFPILCCGGGPLHQGLQNRFDIFLIPRDDTLAFFPISPMYVPFIIIF